MIRLQIWKFVRHLEKKSILALTLYLCFFIATIGSVVYLVVEPPVRDKLERNLDLRTTACFPDKRAAHHIHGRTE